MSKPGNKLLPPSEELARRKRLLAEQEERVEKPTAAYKFSLYLAPKW